MLLMNPKTLSFQRHFSTRACSLLVTVSLFGVGVTIARADPVSELASFSVFDKVDLAQLAKSDVKTAHGPPMQNSAIPRRAKLLCRAGIACAANGGIAPMEPGKISRTEGVPAL